MLAIIWLIIAILFGVAELLSGAFVLLAISLGALTAATAVWLLPLSTGVSLLVFAAGCLLFAPLSLWLRRRGLGKSRAVNLAEPGYRQTVQLEQRGEQLVARLSGTVYPVQPLPEQAGELSWFKAGNKARVNRIDGITLLVSPEPQLSSDQQHKES